MSTSEPAEAAPGRISGELDWSALPPPRRPFRRLTLIVMAVTGLLALLLLLGLRGEMAFALGGGPPVDVGELNGLTPERLVGNSWVRAEGTLAQRVVRYSRPLDSDHYRLAPIEGNPRIWVELREPADADGAYFVPPASFVGRAVRADAAGLRYGALTEAAQATGQALPNDAWLLIDGESPASTRWVLGLGALLLAFAGFNLIGLARLMRPIRDVPPSTEPDAA